MLSEVCELEHNKLFLMVSFPPGFPSLVIGSQVHVQRLHAITPAEGNNAIKPRLADQRSKGGEDEGESIRSEWANQNYDTLSTTFEALHVNLYGLL